MADEMAEEAVWPCPVCGVEQNLQGKRLRSERSVTYHIIGKSKWEWRMSHQPHVAFIRSVNADIDASWKNSSLANEIIDEVRAACSPIPLSRKPQNNAAQGWQLSNDESLSIVSPKIEKELRTLVTRVLLERYGEGECCWCDSPWWHKGVDEKSRLIILTAREQRSGKRVPTEYAGINELKQIMLSKPNWELFEVYLTKCGFEDKSAFTLAVDRIHRLRNDSVHGHDEPFSDEDVLFAEQFWAQLDSISSDTADNHE